MQLLTRQIRKGVPLRKLWTAAETVFVKNFIENLSVQFWNHAYTEVDHANAIIRLPSSTGGGAATPYDGDLWVQGHHFYDDENFSPDNTNGTAIDGNYSGATHIMFNLATGAASYSESGPVGATWGDNIVWRKISECGGSGRYILC